MTVLVPLWGSLLVILFDGSLRPPPDPISGYSSTGLRKFATCGAAVLGSNGTSLVALGGRYIPMTPRITSGDAEYEGLILGLEWMNGAAERGILDPHFHMPAGQKRSLTVRGDCKTVINHLNQDANPRKLRPKYDIVVKSLERLREILSAKFGDVDVTFEHVLREENALTDAICGAVMNLLQLEAISDFREAIISGKASASSGPVSSGKDTSKAKKKRNTSSHGHFEEALLLLSAEYASVPASARPWLYRELATAALHVGDGLALCAAGEKLMMEANRFPAKRRHRAETDFTSYSPLVRYYKSKEHIEVEGISLHIQGLRLLGRWKEAERMEQKHRHILNRFGNFVNHGNGECSSSVLFGETWKSAGQQMLPIPKVFHELDNEQWEWSLLRWHRLSYRSLLIQGKGRPSRNNERCIELGIWMECQTV